MAAHNWIDESDTRAKGAGQTPDPAQNADGGRPAGDVPPADGRPEGLAGEGGEQTRGERQPAAAPDEPGAAEDDEFVITDFDEVLLADESSAEQPKPKEQWSTVAEIEGEPFDPMRRFAVLALVDIAPPIKKLRLAGGPQFFHLTRPVTLAGSGKTARVRLDDVGTIAAEHAAIAFKNGEFRIYPQEGAVQLNGVEVGRDGEPLAHGAQIAMGSARFVFTLVTNDN